MAETKFDQGRLNPMPDETMLFTEPAPSFTGDAPAAYQGTALPDRRELALVAMERTRMPMVITDPRQHDNPIVLANHAFLELTGYSAEEVIGRNCRFLQGQLTSDDDIDTIRRGLSGVDERIDLELLNRRKDGTYFWSALSISPVYDEEGALIYYFGSQKDVTARRRAEELEATERLLLMEVDHRAMNAMALVQSIMRLSRSDNIEDYSATVLGRIDALSRAHRLTAETGWTTVRFADLVTMETDRVPSGQIVRNGPDEHISAKLVQPMTLILHELVTNARKHGALSQPLGCLSIDWTVDDDNLHIIWSEEGAGPIVQDAEHGLGLKLVTNLIERQLNGSFTIDWRKTGIMAQITLPRGLSETA